MNRPRSIAAFGCTAILGVCALTACDRPAPTGQAQADAETRTACRARAEQTYEQQNRGAIYSPPSQVNTPYSANYLPSDAGRGLSALFVHDRMVNDCIRNTGTGTNRLQPTATVPLLAPTPR